jgi:hypothetical protein
VSSQYLKEYAWCYAVKCALGSTMPISFPLKHASVHMQLCMLLGSP